MNKEFDSKPVYGGSDKYINTKQSHMIKKTQIFRIKKYQKKIHHTNVCH